MFPQDNYTPYGYLDNPFHTWKLNRSGAIRVHPPCGFGWLFPNAHSPFIYRASFNVGILIGDQRFLFEEDFKDKNVPLLCSYHSKNLFRFNWHCQSFDIIVEFFLAGENVLAAIVKFDSSKKLTIPHFSILLHQSVYLEYRKTGLWDFGLTGRFDDETNSVIIKSFAEGYVFTTKPSMKCQQCLLGDDLTKLRNQEFNLTIPEKNFFSTTSSSLFSLIQIPVKINQQSSFKMNCIFTRGVSENKTIQLGNRYLPILNTIRNDRIKEDEQFWQSCPKLEGDWPEHWKRGWVYDWETLRMNLREPVGIFSTRWDAMQIQKPRIVLAETALDMLMMSYAHPVISQEVILGLFQDALSPQVPCAREDGSLNMISEDGSECGTSPAWCFPFYCFESMLMRHYDHNWLQQLFPFLDRYLNWWLENRVDEEGWAIYNCSWESGQDASSKFLIPQTTGGEIVSHLRAVDLQAAMAQSATIMSFFSRCLNQDNEKWDMIARRFKEKTQAMWQGDWYCDFDNRTQSWFNKVDYRDVTNLAPLFCGLYQEDQLEKVRLLLEHFKDHPKLWLEWASFFFMYMEACWQTGFNRLASQVLFSTVDRVYQNWDRRSWQQNESMPGVSVECWGLEKPYGSEGYGWAATLPLHIIRSLIGYREDTPNFQHGFLLCPNFPEKLMVPGKKYSISDLKFQGKHFSIHYEVHNEKDLICYFTCEGKNNFCIQILDQRKMTIKHTEIAKTIRDVELELENRKNYYFEFPEVR